ncbi:MAG: LLM class flavin-dependent oxidoreductase [SAR202 cluster bacterium]|nr:LLM class flavin-dependent oxidoreductase [SAR202 cluster bacterium]
MKLGLFTMPLHPPGSDPAKTFDDDLEQLVTLDNLGYQEAWIGEHFTTVWENIPAPDLFIAKALPMTKNIILGTGVTCMPNHNPFMIAHRIAQLDNMAKGRFHWGVGSGGFPGDFTVFGYDMATGEHRTMAREAVELIIKLWNDPKPGKYESKWWSFNVPEPVDEFGLRFHLKPYTKPHPPIGVAGVSEKSDTLVLAGERGWIPLSINFVPERILLSHWKSIEQGAAKAGRKPDRSRWRIAREVYIADTTKEARKEAINGILGRDFNQYFLPLSRHLKVMNLYKHDVNMPDSDVTVEWLVDNIFIVGSPDDVAQKIRKLHHDVGGFGVLLAMGHEWQPKKKWTHYMELLAKEVLPKLSDLK